MGEIITASGIVTGVISGLVASLMLYAFLLWVRPKIHVADKLCLVSEGDDGIIVRVKVVNRTRSAITNVKYSLDFFQKVGDGVCNVDEIRPLKKTFKTIAKYSGKDKNAEYAVRFSYKIPPDMRMSEGWLEFSIYANHGFSGTSA